MDQYSMFLVFLDLLKAYDTIDHGRFLAMMEGYSTGPNMCRKLAVFCNQQEVFIHQIGYHGPHFKETRGITQGRLT